MPFQVIAPFVSCLVFELFESDASNFNEAVEAGYQEIYIYTLKGIIKHQSFRPGKDGKSRFVRIKVDSVPGLQLPKPKVIEPQVSFLPEGKIPVRLLEEVKAFFKAVIAKRGTAVEAMIWILWNQEAGYHLFVPPQKVSKASAIYDWSTVPPGSSIIVDIHSHADFNAFFSGTDNADDRGSIRYSGVIGHNTTDKQSMVWRFNCQPTPIDVTMDQLFEAPVVEQLHVPESWLEKVQAPDPITYTKGTYHNNGSQYPRGNYNVYQQGKQQNIAGVGGEEEGRVWTGAGNRGQNGKLTHGPWGDKSKNVQPVNSGLGEEYDDPFVSVGTDPVGGGVVVTHKTSRKDRKAARRNNKQGGNQSAISNLLTKEEIESADEKVIGNLAEFLVGKASNTVVNPSGPTTEREVDEMLGDEARDAYFATLRNQQKESLRGGAFADSANLHSSKFDENAIDYGPDAAFAAEDMSIALDQLQGSDDLLGQLSAKAFELMDEGSRLDMFRKLYQSLPREAQATLADQGF